MDVVTMKCFICLFKNCTTKKNVDWGFRFKVSSHKCIKFCKFKHSFRFTVYPLKCVKFCKFKHGLRSDWLRTWRRMREMFPNFERTKEREISVWVSIWFVGHEGFHRFRFQMTFWNDKFLRFWLRENLIFGCWQTKMHI